jgi:hypothetical protein
MCPYWPPSLDEIADTVRILLLTKPFSRFEYATIYAARVLNTSKVGSHIFVR